MNEPIEDCGLARLDQRIRVAPQLPVERGVAVALVCALYRGAVRTELRQARRQSKRQLPIAGVNCVANC